MKHGRTGTVKRALLAGLLTVTATACVNGRHRSSVSALDLPTAVPSQHGLDAAKLEILAGKVTDGAYGSTHSVLVMRNGFLVFERYFGGWGPEDLHEVQSISKSIVSLATGIALDRGEIETLDASIVDFFPELRIANLDDRKRAITIRHALMMSTGTDYEEGYRGSPHSRLNRLQSGWTQFWLDRPMEFNPGAGWRYDSGGVIALSSVFQKVTGMHVDDYARAHIFQPLGILRYHWERNAEGHPHAGGGLHLRPRDMAKIGQLLLNRGVWNKQRIVSADWIARSTALKFKFRAGNEPIIGYAYLWWVLRPDPGLDGAEPIVAGTGLGGQYVFVIPDRSMVVVVTGWSDDREEASAPLKFLYEDVLASVGAPRQPRTNP